MTRFPVTLTVGAIIVALSGSVASAALPPTVVWSDNFVGANGTGISTLPGWAAIPTFSTLTSYAIENTFSPPVSARTFGMNNNAVYTLQTTVAGMSGKTSQWFHFKAHQANGVSTTLLDEVRVTTSGGYIFYFRIAERQSMALFETPADNSGNLGDKLSDNAWHEFDIKYNNSAGSQTITYLINNATAWTKSATSPGYITSVQFVQQGGAKPATGENHLIGEMAVGTADLNCTPPAAPTGINASSSTVCSGASSTLSVNNPGAGLTTDWFTGGCGTTPVQNGTGVNSVNVSPTSTTTYYARTRDTNTTCVSVTCQSVTVTVPNCNDGNACTNDTCSNGVCQHTNASNGTACDDGNICTQSDTCQAGTCVGGSPSPNCNNGFEPNRLYVIRSGTWDSEVRMLDETALDANPPVHNPSQPADPVYHMDLGPFGTQADRTWPIAVATLFDPPDGNGSQDQSIVKSICFTNSPVAGQHSPAGARFFGVYDVRALDEPGTSIDETTYFSSGFQIVELNSAGKRIRVMKVGLAANTNPGNTSTDSLTDLCWHGCGEGADPVDYRNNTNGCRIGTIRYNRAKNTLCVAANIGEHDNGDVTRPPVGRVYEFELPDWSEVYFTAQDAPAPNMVGEPVPQSDPNLVRLVQIYEMPNPHSIMSDNGRTGRNPGQRPSIDFDDAGNMYFTSRFFSATSSTFNGSIWVGEGLWQGDVVKCNTFGHYAGTTKYVIPVTGADASNLVIQAQAESDTIANGGLEHTHWFPGPGLAVRKASHQLVQVATNTCNCVFTSVFDLNSTAGSATYPHELHLDRILSGNLIDPGSGACPASVNPFYFETPRLPHYAQYNDTSGRLFFANLQGDCGGVQNFMCLMNTSPPTYNVVGDIGYSLTHPNPDNSSAGTLNTDWDGASRPGAPVDQTGACCLPGNTCQSLSQTACAAANGYWQGNGTTCGQYPCPSGACYRPCTACQQTSQAECQAMQGSVFAGLGSVCGQSAPRVCPTITLDGDCDGDVDMDDFGLFQLCYNPGGSIPGTPSNCVCFDVAGGNPNGPDGVIDHFDFDAFMGCASHRGVPAAPCP